MTVTETPAGDSDDEIDIIPPTPVSGVVFTAICSEDDGNPVADASDLRYSVIEGGEGVFSINVTTGEFSVADQPFDYEEQQWYLVSLLCYLDSDPSMNGTGAVNVTIGPVNEYLPEIESTQTTGTLAETASVGTKIAAVDASIGPLLTYSATDRDDGPDGAIEFLLSTDDERIQKFFQLETSTGTLTLNEGLDVDDLPNDVTFERLEIPITACNENVQISICKNIVLILFITSANDNLPEFAQPQYTASVNESATIGTALLQVECSDEDNGVGAVQSIAFQENTPNTTTAAFALDSTTGALSLRSELDYEKTTSYQFTLVCSDGKNTATTQVSVSVLSEIDTVSENDTSLHFMVERYEFSAYRTDPYPSDTVIGTVEVATVADQGEVGGTVTYSISSSYFKIDQETGEITLKDYLYISDGGTFEFEVVASDGERETTASVRVTTTGLLSVPEWIFVGLGSAILLVILVIVGIIVLYCFIKAARVREHVYK